MPELKHKVAYRQCFIFAWL